MAEYLMNTKHLHSFQESARLHIQHWMATRRLGYLLHPSIPRKKNMRIMDLGTGNACWLLELAKDCPSTWQLQGSDISALQYPAVEYLPENVSLETFDAFREVPKELVGKFNVVHCRFLCCVIKRNNVEPLLRNAIKMLKPGGYLQWEDNDGATFHAHSPNASTCKENSDRFFDLWRQVMAKKEIEFGWISNLFPLFQSSGLEMVESFRLQLSEGQRKAATDNYLIAMEGICALAADKDIGLLDSDEEFRALFAKVLQETQKGVSPSVELVAIVGRKPTSKL